MEESAIPRKNPRFLRRITAGVAASPGFSAEAPILPKKGGFFRERSGVSEKAQVLPRIRRSSKRSKNFPEKGDPMHPSAVDPDN